MNPLSSHKKTAGNTVDPAEINKFQDLAAQWWDIKGPMAPLHAMNPARLEFITSSIRDHFHKIKGVSILDVGCGGGVVSEPLARLGARVTGIDGASDLIAIAKRHAADQTLKIDYETALTGGLIKRKAQFDVVLALEVIEHVSDPELFVSEIAQLVRPGGLVIFSTLNRTPRSFAFGIVAAERLLHWLPKGTHQWRKFVKPSELHQLCVKHNIQPHAVTGLVYQMATGRFALDARDLRVNYLLCGIRHDK